MYMRGHTRTPYTEWPPDQRHVDLTLPVVRIGTEQGTLTQPLQGNLLGSCLLTERTEKVAARSSDPLPTYTNQQEWERERERRPNMAIYYGCCNAEWEGVMV